MELIAATSGTRSNNLVLTSAGMFQEKSGDYPGRKGSKPITAVRPTAKLRYTHFGVLAGLLGYFPDWTYLNAKSVARRLLASGRS
jgi:hypothetical protein